MFPHLLENPSIRESAFPVTVPFYQELVNMGMIGKSCELLEGVIIQKMSKSPLHFVTLSLLAEQFRSQLPDDVHVREEGPLELAQSVPEPDLAVVPGVPQDYFSAHPREALLVIEIAVTSLEIELAKAPVYAAAGIQEYWILRPLERSVEIHTQPLDGTYRQRHTITAPIPITSRIFPTLVVPWSVLK